MTSENPNWVPCEWTTKGVPYMWSRRKSDEQATNDHIGTSRASSQDAGAAVHGELQGMGLGQGEGDRQGPGACGTPEDAGRSYDLYLHANIWHARRVLANGTVVCGLGFDQQGAIDDLEANWGKA